MKKFHMSVLAASSIFAVSAQAAPMFSEGNNAIGFYVYENQYRSVDACAAGGCLDATSNDPAGFQRVNPAIAGNIAQGDVFAGVISVREIVQGNGDVWLPSNTDQFSGYIAQQVMSISGLDANNLVTLTFGAPTTDPFGKLGVGEMLRLYTDSATTFTTGGTTFSSIARATDGTLWAAMTAAGGYAYTLDNPFLAGASQFVSKNYAAYNISTYGAAYNAGLLNLVNDASESEVGGVTAAGDDPQNIVCSAADIASGVVACTQAAGQSDIRQNSTSGPWYYLANDPLWINKVPEPGTLALLGLSLFGLGAVRRRNA